MLYLRKKNSHGLGSTLIPPTQEIPVIQHGFVFLRDICDEKLLTMFRKKTIKMETDDTDAASNIAPNDIMASQNSGQTQRKRKFDHHCLDLNEYLPPAKFRRKKCLENSDPLEGVDINKLVTYLEKRNEKDRKFLQAARCKSLRNDPERVCMPTLNSETEEEILHPYGHLKSLPSSINRPAAFSSFKCTQCMPTLMSETEEEKLHPFGHLKSLPFSTDTPAAFSSFKSTPLQNPPYLTKQDNTSNNDTMDTYRGVSDPPTIDLYVKEKIKVSFSGRCCKPNDAFFNEFYTDLDKVLRNLNNKPKYKKGLHEKRAKQCNTGTEKDSTTVTQKRAVTNVSEMRPFMKSIDQIGIEQAGIESPLTTWNRIEVLNSNEEVDIEGIEDNVHQKEIIEQRREQGEEEKYFQLDIGDKLVYIPTDASTEIPKAYVMDKHKAPEIHLNTGLGKSLVFEQKSSVDPTGIAERTVAPEIHFNTGTGKSLVSEAQSSVHPAGITEDTVVKSEIMDDSADDSVPKITSVFSLSADRVSTENDNVEAEIQTNVTGQDRNTEIDSFFQAPIETHNASGKLSPSPTTEKKEIENSQVSLTTATDSKLLKNPTNHSSGKCPISPGSSVCQLTSSSATKLRELKKNSSNIGKLERLVKSTGKALNQSNVFTLSASNISGKIASDVKQSINSSSAQKLLIIPKLNGPHSEGRSTLFITSTQNNKLQNLLPNSKLRFIVDKPQTPVPTTNSCKRNPGVKTTGLAVVPKDPSRPILLFPNKTNASFKPIVSGQKTVNVNNSLHSKTVPSFFKTANRGNQSTASSHSGLVTTASNNGLMVQSGVLSAVNDPIGSSERSMLSGSAPINTKPNGNDIQSQCTAEYSHPNTMKKINSSGQEWVTVKSKPGDKHKFEAAIFTVVVKEKNISKISNLAKTIPAFERTISQTRDRDKEQTPEHSISHVHTEKLDTKERIRQLREKMRNHQEECESLKKTLSSDSES
ncbi:uncharacterized protein LOC134279411 [Saccostrea cucullata]|uniref:uncharacterized protein LOC134279411 n=1 Tax=Saccostrea cuccullata TaxID=36930 RepID=UPI002ED3B0F2